MISTPKKFKKPTHTKVASDIGDVIVSTIHFRNSEFETMVFPIRPNGGMDVNAQPLFEGRAIGEGSAEKMHTEQCQQFDKENRIYLYSRIGHYTPHYQN